MKSMKLAEYIDIEPGVYSKSVDFVGTKLWDVTKPSPILPLEADTWNMICP
jgi:hypothetical protein